eukprot:838153-Amphidinium_carterae.1
MGCASSFFRPKRIQQVEESVLVDCLADFAIHPPSILCCFFIRDASTFTPAAESSSECTLCHFVSHTDTIIPATKHASVAHVLHHFLPASLNVRLGESRMPHIRSMKLYSELSLPSHLCSAWALHCVGVRPNNRDKDNYATPPTHAAQ